MNDSLTVLVGRELLQAILEGARKLYPRETILLLRGKKAKDVITVSDLVVPPLATHGQGFASIRVHMLPMDFSIVGTVHSHPSGNLMPSPADLNHFFGVVLMIVGSPFTDERNVVAYDHNGKTLMLQVTKT
jgi:proteasome lid subunit RPN8/RPN11